MANISLEDANAWTDKSKLILAVLEADLEAAQASEVIARLTNVYAVSGWTGPTTTPTLVRKIIAMLYVGWYYQRTYSEDEETNSYGLMLIAQAERLLAGLEDGTLTIPGAPTPGGVDPDTRASVSFYPTDASSAQSPTIEDMSLGPAKFTMGTLW